MTDEKQHKETSPASTGSGQPSIFLFSLLFIGAFGLAMGFWILANFEAKHIGCIVLVCAVWAVRLGLSTAFAQARIKVTVRTTAELVAMLAMLAGAIAALVLVFAQAL
jgi:hypothetical protein